MIEGQVSVPTLVLHDRTVPGPARLLYCLLCSYADQPHRQWNGLAGLADDLDMSSEQVVGLMEVLVKRYFISVVRLKEAASRNIYIIADLDDIYSARAGEVKIRTPRPG